MIAAGERFEKLLEASEADNRSAALKVAGVAALVLAAFWFTGLLDVKRMAEGAPAVVQIASEMLPPDFARWRSWMGPLFDTLAMSVAGTAVAIGLSVPLGLLAAANTSPNRIAYRLTRLLLNALRAVPELIMGILFVAAVGFGVLPGVLALGLHSVGMIAKFFAEIVEHVDEGPLEAARAAGATPLQVMMHAILPQAAAQMADTAVYRWEYNFRASAVMGAVGAGGIGTELMSSLRLLDYPQVFAILLCILVCVTMVDALGAMLRRRLA
jgi:phosphonate transport system permease protein